MDQKAAAERCKGLNMQLCTRQQADGMYEQFLQSGLYPSLTHPVDAWLSKGVAVNVSSNGDVNLQVQPQPSNGTGAGALCCGLSTLGDALFNVHKDSTNDGNWSLVCSQRRAATPLPTARPTQGPTESPTPPTWAPTISPTFSPTDAPTPPTPAPTPEPTTGTPTISPTFAPTDRFLHPDEIAKEAARAKAAKEESAMRAQKLAQHAAVLRRMVQDQTNRKRAKNMKIANKLFGLHKQLERETGVVKRFGSMCSSSSSNALNTTAIRLELQQLRLPVEVQKAAMHKAQIVRGIKDVVLKLRKIYQLTDAHGMYAMDKLGPKIIALTEMMSKQKVFPDGSVDREIQWAPPPPLFADIPVDGNDAKDDTKDVV